MAYILQRTQENNSCRATEETVWSMTFEMTSFEIVSSTPKRWNITSTN